MVRVFRDDVTRADIVYVGLFSSVFFVLGIYFLLFFSSGSVLLCNKRTDQCTVQYDYVLGQSDTVEWKLSKTKSAYLQKKTSREAQNVYDPSDDQPVTYRYRVVFLLFDYTRIPFLQGYTGGIDRQNKLKEDFQRYLKTMPEESEYQEQFTCSLHTSMVALGGGAAVLSSFFIFWYGLIRKRSIVSK